MQRPALGKGEQVVCDLLDERVRELKGERPSRWRGQQAGRHHPHDPRHQFVPRFGEGTDRPERLEIDLSTQDGGDLECQLILCAQPVNANRDDAADRIR